MPRKTPEQEKSKLHPRSKHRSRYDFKLLIKSYPELNQFVMVNKYGSESIEFSNPLAVMALNKALLKHYYGIQEWNIPKDYLCPPIPGRADYIHHIADLLADSNQGNIPVGEKIRCLDIGVGANCIYPLLGSKEYDWNFIGSEVDSKALVSAMNIVKSNPPLEEKIQFITQEDKKRVFKGVIEEGDLFDISISNPPFHASAEEAEKGTLRKLNNLNKKKISKATLNFGGVGNELWCEGGEKIFIRRMIHESKLYAQSCFWFSTLVSNESKLKSIYAELRKANPTEVKTIEMGQGNKTSRIVAWTFLSKEQQEAWAKSRW